MRVAFSALVTTALLALPVVAHADSLDDFDLTGHGLTLTFTLPSSPTPTGKNPHQDFYIGNVTFVEDGVTMVANDAYFYTKPSDGGFDLEDANGNVIDDLSFTGPKLFTGPVGNPTFKTGDFTVKAFFSSCTITDTDALTPASACFPKYNLAITPESTVTPEPGSLTLLGTGALGVLGMLRRRLTR